MLTRRQKNSLRGFTAALTCSALLAAFLIFTNISNASDAEPVVFSEILEGAVAYNDGNQLPEGYETEPEMTETMFAEELATFTLRLSPDYTYAEPVTTRRPSPEDTPIDVDGLSGNTTAGSDDTTVSAPETQTSSSERNAADTAGNMLLPNEVNEREPEDTAVSATTREQYATYSQQTTTTTTAATTVTTAPSVTVRSTSSASATTTAAATSITTTRTTTAAATTTRATTTTTPATTTTTTARSTTTTTAAATTTAATTATTAETTTHSEKPPFINVGGGIFSDDPEIYLTMFMLVNQARKEAGVGELWYSARVHDVCRIRTQELTSYYSHTRPDGTRFSTAFREAGVAYKLCGENIAYGRNMFTTPEEVFKAWMDSPSHKENILNPEFDCVAFGLSVLKVGNDTYYYWSQEFARLS